MEAEAQKKRDVTLSEDGGGRILCTTEDFHNFVIQESEAVRACMKSEAEKAKEQEIVDSLELTFRRIQGWCEQRSGRVHECRISPRTNDIIVVVVATDEDAEGTLHDEMIDLDLQLFDMESWLNLYFLMLRRSEADGIASFVSPERSRILYRANGTATHQGG